MARKKRVGLTDAQRKAKVKWVRKEMGKMFRQVKDREKRAKEMKAIWKRAHAKFGR